MAGEPTDQARGQPTRVKDLIKRRPDECGNVPAVSREQIISSRARKQNLEAAPSGLCSNHPGLQSGKIAGRLVQFPKHSGELVDKLRGSRHFDQRDLQPSRHLPCMHDIVAEIVKRTHG